MFTQTRAHHISSDIIIYHHILQAFAGPHAPRAHPAHKVDIPNLSQNLTDFTDFRTPNCAILCWGMRLHTGALVILEYPRDVSLLGQGNAGERDTAQGSKI